MSRHDDPIVLHASAVAIDSRGLLILGASGAGKSGLALRLMALGAQLIADDRVILTRRGETLMASAPKTLAGLVEARGIGILRAGPVTEAALDCAVDLDRCCAARMPQLATITYLGSRIDLISGRDIPNLEAALVLLMRNGRASPR